MNPIYGLTGSGVLLGFGSDMCLLLALIVPSSIVETITAMTFPMLYLSKPVEAQELVSKVEGATYTQVAKDFPETYLKSGKAKELRSKFQ